MNDNTETMTETEFSAQVELMRQAGQARAIAAASWILDGNSTEETARAILKGIEDIDGAVLDMLPTFSFGEWSGESESEMIDLETDLEADSLSADEMDELANAFLDGFGDEISMACERECRAFLGLE